MEGRRTSAQEFRDKKTAMRPHSNNSNTIANYHSMMSIRQKTFNYLFVIAYLQISKFVGIWFANAVDFEPNLAKEVVVEHVAAIEQKGRFCHAGKDFVII